MAKFIRKITKSFQKEEKGFTLIELLIVIVILGVLAAAIIPNLSKFIGSGTVGAANAELASVRTAVGAYQADNQAMLPTSDGKSGTIVNALITGGSGYVQGTVVGAYTVDSTGLVTGVSYTTLTWDGTHLNWKK